MKQPKNYSISQLNKYDDCPRMHYYQYVCGIPTPSTDAQEYGKKCHSYLEQYLKGEISSFPNNFHGRTCQAGLSYLPEPRSGEVEKFFEMKLEGLHVPIIGYMDYCSYDANDDRAVLLDHKIVKSDQYALTPDKLAKTNQVITYSKFLLDYYKTDMVQASYLYFKRGGSWVNKVTVDLTRDRVEDQFQSIIARFEDMQNNYTTTQEDNVPQILASCEKWGGCPFKSKCWGDQKGDTMSLLDKLLASTAKPKTQEATEAGLPSNQSQGNSPSTSEESKLIRHGIFSQIQKLQIKPLQPINQADGNEDLFGRLDNVQAELSDDIDPDDDIDLDDDKNVFQLAAESEMIPRVLVSDAQRVDLEWSNASLIDTLDAPSIEVPAVAEEADLAIPSVDVSMSIDTINDIYEEDMTTEEVLNQEPTDFKTEAAAVEPVIEAAVVEAAIEAAIEPVVEAAIEAIVEPVIAAAEPTVELESEPIASQTSSFDLADDTDSTDLEAQKPDWLCQTITELAALANRPKNALDRHGFYNIEEVLYRYPKYSYLKDSGIKGFGKAALDDFAVYLKLQWASVGSELANAEWASLVRLFIASIPTEAAEPELPLSIIIDNSAQTLSAVEPQAVEAQEVVEPQAVEAQEVIEAQEVVEPQAVEAQDVIEAQEVVEPQAVEAQEVVEAQAVVEAQDIVEPQAVVEAQDVVEPQAVVEAQDIVEPQAAVEAQDIVEPQAVESKQAPNDQVNKEQKQAHSIPRILLLGSMAIKGLSVISFDDIVGFYESRVEVMNNVPHISLIDYSKGYDYVAVMIKNDLANGSFNWSKTIYVSAQAQITYAKAVHALIQKADIVIKNC